MLVAEFFPQAKVAFAGCDEATIFSRLSDAVKLLANKGITDSLLGELELCVCGGCTTLPRQVGTVLGVDVCGQPTLLQDQWFKYHINGPGVRGSGACGVVTEMGQFCTFRDPAEPAYLIAEVTSAADNNKKLRVFATRADNGQKIFTPGPDGKLYEGFLVPLIFGYPQRNPDVPALGAIYRISKEVTKDFVKLFAVKASDGVSQTLVGHYEPDETLPQYRRLRVPNKTSVLVKYKLATFDIKSQRDFIPLDNFEALRLACRAVKCRLEDALVKAKGFEDEASRILAEETEAKRPSGPRVPQIITDIYQPGGQESLFYSDNGPGYGGNW
jgi:hypothetical protein